MARAHPTGDSGLVWRAERTIRLVRVLAPRDLRLRYRQSLLDVAWVFIAPVVIMVVYGYILTRGFDATMECGPYATSAWFGVVLWTFFGTAVGGGVHSLIGSADLVGKLYFPREALPLSGTIAALGELLVGMATVMIVGVVQGVRFSPYAALVALPLMILILWAAAFSVLVAVVASFVRDTVHAVDLGLRVGFFATPVMYDIGFLPAAFRSLSEFNPVAVAIVAGRQALFCGGGMNFGTVFAQLGAGLVALVLVVLYTRSVEARIPDVL